MAAKQRVYVVEVSDVAGRIWSSAPCIQKSGLLSLLCPVAAKAPFVFARFSVRGDQFALLDKRGSIYAFHVLQNRYSLVLRAGSCPLTAEFSPAPKSYLAVAFADHTIRVIDINIASVVATLKGHHSDIITLSFHPSGQYLTSTSADRVVVWDTRSWTRRRTLDTHDVRQASFAPSGASIITCVAHDGIMAWDTLKFRMQYRLPPPKRGSVSNPHVHLFTCSSDGRYILGAGASPNLFLWESHILALLRIGVMPVTVTSVVAAAFLPESDVAVVLGDDGVLIFYHVLSLKILLTLAQPHKCISSFSIGSGGRYVACVCSDGTVCMFDLDTAFASEEKVQRKLKKQQKQDSFRFLGSLPVFGSEQIREAPTAVTSHSFPAEDTEAGAPSTLGKSSLGLGKIHANDGIDRARGDASSSSPDENTSDSNEDQGKKANAANANAKTMLHPDKLKSLLRSQGEYPERYRVLIWRFQLRVPENRSAFAALASQGVHAAFVNLDSRYPLQDRRLFRRLQRICSTLAYWTPLFGEVEYLPAFVFPFIRVFGADDVVTFEAIATLLLNWCSRWFEFFPNPPVALLQEMEVLLHHHDEELLSHLAAHGIDMHEYAWPMLHTLLTEILPATAWKVVMDHIVSNRPSLLIHIVIAALRCHRRALLTLTSRADMLAFLRAQHPLDPGELLRSAYSQRRCTPDEIALKNSEWTSLPTDTSYPAFTAFPKFVVDFQLKERERIRTDERELEAKRSSLSSLSKKTEELLRSQQAWRGQQAALRQAEQERRQQWMIEEEARLRERQRLDRAAHARRTQQLEATSAALAEQMRARQEQRAAELKRLEDEETRRRAREQYELEARLEEEALLNLEFQMHAQAVASQDEQEHDAMLSSTQVAAETAAKRRERELAEAKERWRLEDDERRVRARLLADRRAKIVAMNEQMRSRREVEAKVTSGDAEHEAAMARVLRERRLRHLAQDELERREQYVEEEKKRLEILRKEDQMVHEEVINSERRFRDEVDRERERIIDAERRRAGLEAEKRARRLEELDREQRRREFEEAAAARHADEVKKLVSEEKEMQAVLASVEEETRRGRQLELEIRYRDERAQEQLAFARVMKDAKKSVIADERTRYQHLMDEMKAKFAREEAELERQHKSELDRIVGERERTFADHSRDWRDEVRSDEVERIKQEHSDNRRRQQELRQRHQAEADAMRKHITEALANVSLQHQTDDDGDDDVHADPYGKELPARKYQQQSRPENMNEQFEEHKQGVDANSDVVDDNNDNDGGEDTDAISKKAKELLRRHHETRRSELRQMGIDR